MSTRGLGFPATLTSVDPCTDALWHDLVQSRRSDVFHSPAWLRVLVDTYGFETRALVLCEDDGAPRAGMAYCRVQDMMDPRLVSLPFSDFSDPLVEDPEEWEALLSALLREGLPFCVRSLHSDLPLVHGGLSLTKQARWHGMDLGPGLDALWEHIDSASRRAIRKAERSGITVRQGRTEDDLRTFYALHLRVRKYKYRMLAQPYEFVHNIWRQFVEPGNGALLLAEHEGRVIGCVFLLEWKDTLYYKFNASDADRLDVRPNDLLLWSAVQYGKERARVFLDLGLSDWDQEGLVRYKRKFATEEKTISFLRHTPPGLPSQREAQMRQLLPRLTELLTDASVPDEVSRKAGEVLYRYFT